VNQETLRAGLSPLGVPAAFDEPLRALAGDVRAANERLNLLSENEAAEDALLLHVLDALHILADPAARRAVARVIDVGTGGGFPGLPLLAVREGWRGTLLDSVKKKTDALAEIAARRLGDRAEILWDRAEALARRPERRESYDLAFCRAVGRFTTVAELTLPFVAVGGALLAHRGHEAPAETAAAADALDRLGARLDGLHPYTLPGLEKKRYIVRIVKDRPTPEEFPRRDGVPAKRPL
jgi:16S rRNA (guanine527-N7)-methyltransferase